MTPTEDDVQCFMNLLGISMWQAGTRTLTRTLDELNDFARDHSVTLGFDRTNGKLEIKVTRRDVRLPTPLEVVRVSRATG